MYEYSYKSRQMEILDQAFDLMQRANDKGKDITLDQALEVIKIQSIHSIRD